MNTHKYFNIFQHWLHWVSRDSVTVEKFDSYQNGDVWFFNNEPMPTEVDGLIYYDGFVATFWYVLNAPWYEMNNKHSAAFDNQFPYQVPYL